MRPDIKHLVISGGVIYGFAFFGFLKHLHQEGTINMNQIETFHATSIGTIISTILALWSKTTDTTEYDWEMLENYLVHRPWQTVYHFSIQDIFNSYQNGGLFDQKIIEETLRPLFAAKDLDITTITMKEFYDITQRELHFFTVDVHSFQLVNVSHTTHPEWRLIEAIYASSCAPIMFSPLYRYKTDSDKYDWYVDGAFLMNYPIEPCVKWCHTNEISPDKILGLNLVLDYVHTPALDTVNQKMNLLDYLFFIMKSVIHKITTISTEGSSYKDDVCRPYEVNIEPTLQIIDFVTVANSKEERIKLIELGVKYAKEFAEEFS
jgi:predicted acylesterase/phospholipase RssA